jgi:subtilisin family serine protease
MKERGFAVVVLFLILSITLISAQEKFFSNNYLVPPGPGRFIIDSSSLTESQIKLVIESLNGLQKTNDINGYSISKDMITVDLNTKETIKIIMNNQGMFMIKPSKKYIVEFKNPSLAEKEREIAERGESYGIQNAREEESIELSSYKDELILEHDSALNDIKDLLRSEELPSFSQSKTIFGFIRDLFMLNNKDTFLGKILMFGQKRVTGFVINNPALKSEREFYNVFNGAVLNISREEAVRIKESGYVKNVYPDREVKAVLFDSVPMIQANILWGLDKDGNNCNLSGKACINGEGMKIAIVDTGIDYTHPDLGGCFGPGCKVEGGYDFVNNDNDPIDDQGHGTHCAGIAAGDGALKGVAPKAKLYAYKVLDDGGSGSFSEVISGIERAVDPNDDGNFSDKVDVISLSLGGGGDPDDPVSKAIDNAVDAGVIAVVAAGNDGPSKGSIGSPGCARNALTVGAICKQSQIGINSYCDDVIAEFSSRGPVVWSGGVLIKPDVVAPGVEICSSQYGSAWEEKKCFDSKHVAISGTSMATPHVAGAAALIKQAKPELSAKQIKALIETSSENLGKDLNFQGNGKVNLLNALNSKILISESKVNFGNIKAEAINKNIVVKNIYNQPITLNISTSDTFCEQTKQYYNMVSFGESNPVILPNSEYQINLTMTAPPDAGGTFIGSVLLTDNYGTNYSIIYTASRLSNLTLKIEGDHYPYFYIYDDSNEYIGYAEQEWDFLGNRYTFSVPKGNYSVYAINDFLGDGETDEYILMDSVYVPVDSSAEKTFQLQDAKIFTVKAQSREGKQLELFEWTKGVIIYPKDSTAIDSKFNVAFYDPTLGDRKIYLSNNPIERLNVDILLKYLGAPA